MEGAQLIDNIRDRMSATYYQDGVDIFVACSLISSSVNRMRFRTIKSNSFSILVARSESRFEFLSWNTYFIIYFALERVKLFSSMELTGMRLDTLKW